MDAKRFGRGTLGSLALATCTALAVVLFATAAVAEPGNGNGNAYGSGNANASPNGNAYGLENGNNGQAETHQTSGTGGTSGTATLPQPISNADSNGVGANVSGPYDSTRDGSPSLNGNGDGNAIGQPCAGCVGGADNKNPPGQLPGPSDLNAGYECDRNNGIGNTNPAHTGCVDNVVTPPVTPPVVTPPVVTPPVVTPPVVTPPGLTPVSITPPSAVATQPAAVQSAGVTSPRPAALAFTGSNILLELLVGILALGLGVTMLVRSRLQRRHAAS